jgi:hypothetical protein
VKKGDGALAVEKRCIELPVVTTLTEVGSYQVFGD